MTTNPKRNIPTLDGWRALAILLVTFCHAAMSIWSDNPKIVAMTQFGALGVDVFFALSGLLITKLLLEEHKRTGGINLKAFYIRRCFRVLIPCYCYVAFVFLFSLYRNRLELLSSVLFFRNYLSAAYEGPYTRHLWSLAVEEHFYLLWPPILVLVTVKYGREVAMWMSVVCALWRIVVDQYFAGFAAYGFPQYRTDYRLDTLFWGCVAAFLLHESYEKMKNKITPLVWTGILVGYFLCLAFYSPMTRLWMPMLIPLLIVGTLTHPDWMLSRILEWGPIQWIGRLSYSLYLWQMLFFTETSHSPYWWQHFPVNVILALGAAVVSYYFIETPLLRVGKRLSAAVANGNDAAGDSFKAPAVIGEVS